MWMEDNINGYGEYTLSDGQKYVGEWKNNMKHGFGRTED
jgi:hypothetical protein